MPAVTAEERNIVDEFKQKSPWVCYYCNKNITSRDDLTVDHKIPSSRGGLTIEENLAICCLKCNTEKDNMNEAEYRLFKEKQNALCDSLGIDDQMKEMLALYDQIIETSKKVYSECSEVEKQVERLESSIAYETFNASEGYKLAKQMKEMIQRRNQLRISKEAYQTLRCTVENNKRQLRSMQEKILHTVHSKSYESIRKGFVVGLAGNSKSNIIEVEFSKSI